MIIAGADATGKWAAERYDNAQILAIAGTAGALLMALLASCTVGLRALDSPNLKLHLVRGVFGAFNGTLALVALANLPLAEFYVLAFTAPFWVTLISFLVLREQVGWRRFSALAVGFAGVAIAYRPESLSLEIGALAALGSAFCYAASLAVVKLMRSTDPFPVFGFFPLAFMAVLWWPVALARGWEPVEPVGYLVMAASGICVAVGVSFVAYAFRQASASLLAPFQYSQMLWGMLLGFLIWSEVPTIWTLTGAALIIASGLYVAQRAALKARAQALAAAARAEPAAAEQTARMRADP